MQSRKINANVGGDLGSATEEVMAQQGMSVQQNGTMLNSELLPSKGVFYSSPLYVKKLSTIDIKNLNTMNEENANAVLNSVLANCITGIPFNSLLQADKLWLIFYLRSFTYNDYPVSIKYECPDCKKHAIFEAKIADFDVKYLSEDFNENLELPSGRKIIVQYPTMGHEQKANQLKRNDQLIEAVDPELIDVACYIKAIDGQNVSLMQAYEALKNMDAMDFVTFSNYMIDYAVGLNPVMKIPCSCGNEVAKRVSFTPDFFMPKFKK